MAFVKQKTGLLRHFQVKTQKVCVPWRHEVYTGHYCCPVKVQETIRNFGLSRDLGQRRD
jgi:hypothetical protein